MHHATIRPDVPLRVLHVCYGMDPGGIQSWLMDLFRRLDRSCFEQHLLTVSATPGKLDQEVAKLGIPMRRIDIPHKFWSHPFQLRKVLKELKPAIVHSHIGSSGIILRQARLAGVPIRISHSHNAIPYFQPKGWFGLKTLILQHTNRWLQTDATLGLGCSRQAMIALYGDNWESQPYRQILYCGIDLTRFQFKETQRRLHHELALPDDAQLVVHVGRFDPQKNHTLLIQIAEKLMALSQKLHFLLVGDGQLRPEIETMARTRQLNRVHFLRSRNDVESILAEADLFILPSLFEGLGIALVEAQACGLPCVISSTVTREADVVPELIHRCDLDTDVSHWANTILECLRVPPQRDLGMQRLRQGEFNIEYCVRKLSECYMQQVQQYLPDSARSPHD